MSKDTPQAIPPAQAQGSWWRRLKEGLSRSSSALDRHQRPLHQAQARCRDARRLRGRVVARRSRGRHGDAHHPGACLRTLWPRSRPGRGEHILVDEIAAQLSAVARPLASIPAESPMSSVIGVNGSGKTTTIGKLGAKLKAQGRSVMLAAGDRFARPRSSSSSSGERIGRR